MILKVCQDPLNPKPGGGRPPPRTPNLAPMIGRIAWVCSHTRPLGKEVVSGWVTLRHK